MSIENLTSVCPPPEDPPRIRPDWNQVEGDLGFRLPADYRQLIETYGPGSFDGFLHVFQPASPHRPLDLAHQIDTSVAALRTLRDDFSEEVPFRLEQPYEILTFAVTDNGDQCYWLRTGDDPDQWTVLVNEARGPEWFPFDGNATAFLAATLSRRITVPVFPDDFPTDPPMFAPYDI
ncbi:SMI1/KNR4 family protein [Streptomyces sp. H39-S7]|uniref:SMI1/KNR4 family protein n=1 Tax=Streptomyces sp. H39-S7 TaxID=3004357 RepID=UPI0022AEE736|nr:SMI1/KNR4 family protein [Streptomyces sp. H39-S7]MCZ4123102.1 SMI1/KNR4 family protein [Streptomyces sp. H39-S7]